MLPVLTQRLAELEPDLPGLANAVRQAVQQTLAMKMSATDPAAACAALGGIPLLPPIPAMANGPGLTQRFSLAQPFPLDTAPLPQPTPPIPALSDPAVQSMAVLAAQHNALVAAAANAGAVSVKRRLSNGVTGPPMEALQDMPGSAGALGGGSGMGGAPVPGGPTMVGATPTNALIQAASQPGLGIATLISNSGGGGAPTAFAAASLQVSPPLSQATPARAPLATARSLGATLPASALQPPALMPAAPAPAPSVSNTVQSGSSLPGAAANSAGASLPLQSPFCINVSNAAGTGNGAGFSMEALLAQHNAQVASMGSAGTQGLANAVSQAAPSVNTGFAASGATSGALGNARSQGGELQRAGSRNLPFPDMTRVGSTITSDPQGGEAHCRLHAACT